MTERLNKVCIINAFDTYEHRADLLHACFAQLGAEVVVYTSDFSHFEKCQRSGHKPEFRYFHAIPYMKNMSINRMKSHAKLAEDIFAAVEEETFNLLWVMLPPNSFAKEAAKYKSRHQAVKLIFDLIDLWPETMPISRFKSFPPFTHWKNLRNKNIICADRIVTECHLYHQKLPNSVRDSLCTIYLARTEKEYISKPTLSSKRIVLCYLGSINNIIDISGIANLICNIKKYKDVVIHIVGDGEKRDEFISSFKSAGAEVLYHGKIYDKMEKQKIFDVCHYGLNFMKKSVFVGLTMKSMDYFEAGLPILNNIYGDTWDFIEKNCLGYNISSITDYEKISKYDVSFRFAVRNFYEKMFGVEEFDNKVKTLVAGLSIQA